MVNTGRGAIKVYLVSSNDFSCDRDKLLFHVYMEQCSTLGLHNYYLQTQMPGIKHIFSLTDILWLLGMAICKSCMVSLVCKM